MGSSIVASRGASQNSAKVIQCSAMLIPITAAMPKDRPIPISLRTGFDRQRYRSKVDENLGPHQCAEPIGFQRAEHSIGNQKGQEGKGSESRRPHLKPRPEHRRKPQRFEPKSIDVIGRCRAAAKKYDTQDRQQGETSIFCGDASARRLRCHYGLPCCSYAGSALRSP